jgi:hypothetical protein
MEIQHSLKESKFFASDGDEDVVLDYVLIGNKINFTHTFVPTGMRGRGYAEKIVRHGLGWANNKDLTITASCWYVAKFL